MVVIRFDGQSQKIKKDTLKLYPLFDYRKLGYSISRGCVYQDDQWREFCQKVYEFAMSQHYQFEYDDVEVYQSSFSCELYVLV